MTFRADGSRAATAKCRTGIGRVVLASVALLLMLFGLAVWSSAASAAGDPVLAMGFDAGAGSTAADSSVSGNDGAIAGASWTDDGRYGRALRFDGVDDWVTVPDDDTLDLTGDLTLSAWIKPEAANPFMSVLMKEATGSYEYALYATDGAGNQASGWVGASGAYSPSVTALNEWHHLAVTFSDSTVRLYMDGVLKETQTGASAPVGSDGMFRIGGTAVYANEFFKGLIDEVRVYDEALTPAELQTEANTPVTAPRGSDPVLSLSFDEGTGPIARDGSVFHNDGTITGASWTNDGRFGKALSFDGSDDQVVVTDAKSLDLDGDLTVSAWVKPASLRSYMTVLIKERPTASDYAYALYATNGGTQYRPNAWVEATGLYAPNPIATGAWQHLAMVYDSGKFTIYVNGVESGTQTGVAPPLDSAGNLRIGGNTIWNNEFFHGLIDEVRVYNRAVPQRDLVISDTPGNNPGTGDTGFFTFRPTAAALGAKVNVASGNLLVKASDLPGGAGNSHVVVDRFYNSLGPDSSPILSPRWSLDIGPETTLSAEPSGDVIATGPTGYRIRFVKQPDNSYIAPPGFDGGLVKTSSGWALTRTSKSDQFVFSNAGGLDSTVDAASRPFTVADTSSGGSTVLSSYGTPTGQRANFSYNGDGRIRRLDSPASTAHDYRYASGKLTEREDPGPALTTYEYDAEGFLKKITAPNSDKVEFDLSSRGRVHSLTSTPNGGAAAKTRFAYTRRPYKTDVTGPDNIRRTYAYDVDWRVTRQYNPDVVPTVAASGPLYDLRDQYTKGDVATPVTVSATQSDGAGLTRLAVERVGGPRLGHLDSSCTDTPWDRICPTTFSGTVNTALPELSEGRHVLRATARDDENNEGLSESWQVTVDRSAPSAPAAFVSSWDSTSETADIAWTGAADPALPDGSPGSGLDRSEYRTRPAGGAWSGWTVAAADGGAEVELPASSTVDVEIRVLDRVGNVSSTRSESISGAGVIFNGPIDTVEEADAFIDLVVADGNDTRFNTISPSEQAYVADRPGWRWGGSDHVISTDAEIDVVGSALAADTTTVWASLRPQDRVTMMDAQDAEFDTWAPRIDTLPPRAVDDAVIDSTNYVARRGQIAWSSGDDPDVATGVPGSGVDDADFRWRESDGVWRSWATTSERGFGLVNVDAGDVFFLEVRERDWVGRLGPISRFTVTMPAEDDEEVDLDETGPTPRAGPFGPIVACIRYCAKAKEIVVGGVTVTVKRIRKGTLRITRHKSDDLLETWAATRWAPGLTRKAGEKAARKELRRNLEAAGKKGAGKEAHHIVALTHRVAKRAQEILARCGVSPNEAANGVFLTKAQHNRTKTHAYYEAVNRMLELYDLTCGQPGGGPFGQKPIRDALQDLGDMLRKSNFPG